MLDDAHVEAVVPVDRLGVAREFYEGLLGLSASGSHRPDVDVLYELGGGTRLLVVEERIEMRRAQSAAHFTVNDFEAAVRELRARGLVFDEFDLPGLKTVDGIASVDGRRFAWFRDPDNNVLAIHD
jgi:catechol 2,3-dioxygenase-like lactoylglutathione lyase family enzyme